MSVVHRSGVRGRGGRQRGLSLLELLVAFSIMAMALGLLYRSMGSSARNVADMGQQQRALQWAESLLLTRESVGPEGWNESGDTAGIRWDVRSTPLAPPPSSGTGATNPQAVGLHGVELQLRWDESGRMRELRLATVLPERKPRPGESVQ
ncbi:type II secretion system protein [Acidovorax lacteus]|uniref:Prepilin-type N-terminal cleavage/methylation domain-containing protein n=1 Tax=Acidovorax lacteus TaxID=1924988 RepID=A0ABP8KYP8_9BURK